VHDELVFEIPDDRVAELTPVLRQAMVNVDCPFKIKVDCSVGKNFGQMEEMK